MNMKFLNRSPSHFMIRGQICEVKIEKSILVWEKSNNNIQILTGRGLLNCNPNNYLCALGNPIRDKHSQCLQSLFNELPMSRINRVCNIECRRAITNEKVEIEEELPLPLIHSIGYHEYTITIPQGRFRKWNISRNEFQKERNRCVPSKITLQRYAANNSTSEECNINRENDTVSRERK